MLNTDNTSEQSILLMIAGAKGAIGSTVAATVAALQQAPELILPCLTTQNQFAFLGASNAVFMMGWDTDPRSLLNSLEHHNALPPPHWQPYMAYLDGIPILEAPDISMNLGEQVDQLKSNIMTFQDQYPHAQPVLVNLLPSCPRADLDQMTSIEDLYASVAAARFPDLAYALAAVQTGVPVVNFTPNKLEIPLLVNEAQKRGVPLAGRDGKTGQTYLKVVLASALRARGLIVDGWYSLNILGNADGRNLMNPECATGKLAHKTDLLDEVLGYAVGEQYDAPSHKVHIDYYPPRGDAKEAWDVIDFKGIFDLPMGLRLNWQGRDSVLAAPMVLDLARWAAALRLVSCGGTISELGFYFKKAVGNHPPITFQEQVNCLEELALEIVEKMSRNDSSNGEVSKL
jgi:myo-inositol-1-phosphate synthase